MTPTASSGRSAFDDLLAVALLGVAGAYGALSVLAAIGAAVATAATGHPIIPGIDTAATAVPMLASDPGAPDRAWPPAMAEHLPAAPLYWAVHALPLAAACAATVAVRRRWTRSARGHPLRVRAHAGLARGGELRRLHVRRATPGRLTLGLANGRLLAAEPAASLAVIGPTGCGKTAGFAIPALLEWEGPVLATSVKTDLIAATHAHRRRRGRVWVYDPAGASGIASDGFDPVAGCATWAGALRTSAWLTESVQARRDTLGDADYWYSQARRALAPYLHAAALDRRGIADVVRWVDSQDTGDIEAILDRASASSDARLAAGAEHAVLIAHGLWGKEERLRSSVFSTMENVVAPYTDPAAQRPGGIEFDEWLAGDNTIYIAAASHDQARLRPVLTLLAQHAIRAAYDTANRNGGTLPRPCLVLLDEAANIAPLPDLPSYAATGRSHGITIVTIWQDLAQVAGIYRDRAQSLLNNHRAKLFGSGVADLPTLEYVSKLLGDHPTQDRNTTRDPNGKRSITEHTAYRALAPADLCRRIRPDHAICVYGSELPAHVALRPWYRTPALRRRAEGEGA